jgi:anti-anti-sigma regulatory factor
MDIKVTQEQGRVPVTVLHLTGDLSGETYQQLQDCAKQAIDGGARYLLINMAGVNFMGSAGIRAINQIFNWMRSLPDGEDEAAIPAGLRDGSYKSRRLKLTNLNQQVQKTLSVTGIDMFLEFCTDLPKAIASF